uniref:Uncharacterized protein n=1 Tax=Rhizophora mucronata TaxID=61149 RepID=A0A2P2PW97_RHIMU
MYWVQKIFLFFCCVYVVIMI